MVKLRIELALAELIRKIATQRSNEIMGSSSNEISLSHRDRGGGEGRYNNPVSTTTDISGPDASNKKRNATVDDDGSSLGSLSGDNNGIMVRTMVDVEVGSAPASMESSQKNHAKEDDVEPLNASWKR